MSEQVIKELSTLVTATQRMLDCSEPSIDMWTDYQHHRNELFARLTKLPPCKPDASNEAAVSISLLASIAEKDQLLVEKLQAQMSNILQEIEGIAEQRRLTKVYGAGSVPPTLLDRFTA